MKDAHELAQYHVPEHVYRVVHHMHNCIYIRNYFDSLGLPTPEFIRQELERVHGEMVDVYDRETSQGGLLERKDDEARKREPLRRGSDKGRTEAKGSEPRSG